MAPRTDPSERNYRTGFLPRVFGVKALIWMRMHEFELGNPELDDWTEGLAFLQVTAIAAWRR